MTTLIPKYYEGSTSSVNRPINLKLGEFISVADFIPVGTSTSTTDCSSYFTAAFNALIAQGGGTLWIPYGVYKVNLDWSSQVIAGGYNTINIYGNNSILLGVTGATSLLEINNPGSGDNWITSNLNFYDLKLQTESNVCSGGTAVISYAVQILYSSANWTNCTFQGGSIASYYSVDCQYSTFTQCTFVCAGSGGVTVTSSAPCAGVWIQSSYNRTIADQVVFNRCAFGSSPNGLYIQGCGQLKVSNSRFQACASTGTAALWIDQFLDGANSESIVIENCHFEANQKTDIQIQNSTRVVYSQNLFANPIGYNGTKVYVVYAKSDNQSFYNNNFRTASAPNIYVTANLGQLVYLGNDKTPTLDVTGASNPQCIIQDTTTGAIDFQYSQFNLSGYWGKPAMYFSTPVSGGTYLWVSSSGVLRIKSGSTPTSDSDGVAVGSQS
jgi:hypothetical protein